MTFVRVDGAVAGLLAVRDPIKASTRPAIETLHRLGLSIVMLTGDNETTARTVAESLGIEQFEAGVKPQEKYDRVHKLREQGRIVAMAGDGVNDAPALAEADVGMAMGTGAEVTIETADVTLLAGDLRGISRAFLLSRAVMRNIRQNLFFAFVYNLVGVPIAAGVLYPCVWNRVEPHVCGRRDEFQLRFGRAQCTPAAVRFVGRSVDRVASPGRDGEFLTVAGHLASRAPFHWRSGSPARKMCGT